MEAIAERSEIMTRRMSSEEGFTLIEMMIATFVLSISLLGMTGLILTAIQANRQNELRNAAVTLTTQMAEEYFSESFGKITSRDAETVSMDVKGIPVGFTRSSNVTDISDKLKRIELTVEYTYRGNTYTNNSIIYRNKVW